MNNGVEVIVAEDKTLLEEFPQRNTFVDRSKPQGLPPITLPPSTLSNQMLLFASPTDKNKGETAMDEHELMFHYKTYFTTLTYYNTILQDGFPVVRTSKETISNLVSAPIYVSGKFVEKTKINLETSTYLATQTFTKTVGDRLHPEIVTSKEVITQVVVTEVPSVQRSKIDITPSLMTLVTKTYFTTFTYFKTYDGGIVDTETVVSSDIVTEKITDAPATNLPIVSLTKFPNAISDESHPIELFATKTYYTTSTYLTTILQGDQTITSSHIEITSNIVTEPITSMVLNTEGILRPEIDLNDKFEDVHYVPINDNVYKEIKTLYAIYTHFTTLHNGRVKSSEVTKTQLLTATVTTNSIPASLIIQPDQSIHSLKTADPSQPTEIFDDYYYDETDIELDPSYIDTLSIHTPTESLRDTAPSDIKEISDLKATVHVEEGSTSDDTFIVEDSTTKATILVRPTNEVVELQSNLNVLASSQLSLIEISTSPSFDFSDIISDTIKPTTTESAVISATIEDPSLEEINNSTNLHLHSAVPDETLTEESHKSNSTLQAESENEENTFEIGLSPMLTAVAGLIGNTFTGKLAGQTHGARRKIDHPILPKNAIVAAEREPLFIPIGGVGASISNSRDSTLHPEQGFIPLLSENSSDQFQAPEEENQRQDMSSIPDFKHSTPVEEVGKSTVQPEEGFIPLIIKDSQDEFLTYEDEITKDYVNIPDLESPVLLEDSKPSLNPSIIEPVSSMSLEKFGPSFKPPTQTESGFTGITPDKVNPTRVSVISGEETIFFGGFDPQNSPSEHSSLYDSTDILEQSQSSPIHIIIDDNNEVRPHLLQPSGGNDEGYDFRPVIKPGTDNLGNEYYYYADYGNLKDEQYPDYDVENQDSESSKISSSTPILTSINGNKATTLVLGSSTILSGATTVFDNLFTKPADSLNVNEYSGNIQRAVDDRFHDIMMHLSKSKASSTQTTYDKNEEPIESSTETTETETSVKSNLRTLVPSVTQITLTSSSTKTSKPISYTTDTQTQIVSTKSEQSLDNQGSSTELDKQTSHSTTQSSKEEPESKINLAYEEQNEISRVLESQSPHQVLEKPQSTATCIQECSENEICKVFRQEQVCICKPGYSRRSPTQDCRKSESYEVSIVLEKLSDSTLSFSSELKNKSHPNTQFLMKEINSGIEKAMMNSDLSDKYYSNVILDFDRVKEEEENSSLLAKVKIDIEKGEDVLSGSFVTLGEPTNDVAVQAALEGSLQHSNYSLGGGAVYARKEPSSILAATDFDECSFEEHNDCHENALCINLVGTFKCECKEGFQDLFAEEELKTGRQCVQSKTCSFCNYNGRCQISLSEDSEGTTCICNDWFSGKNCDINLKVMLISVISVGSFLLLLFCIFAAFCCCRKKKQSQRGLLGSSSHGKLSTLDRRAMIHDTSSESSEDFTRHRSGTIVDDSLPPMPSTPQADYSIGKKSGMSLTSKDRSMTIHTSIPPVFIPRVKNYNSSSSKAYTLERNPNSKYNYNTNPKTKEEALVEVLEGSNRYNRSQEDLRRSRENILSVHSYATTQRSRSRERNDNQYQKSNYHHSRENQESMDTFKTRARSTSRAKEQFLSEMRSRSADRLDEEQMHNNLHSDLEVNSLRYGNSNGGATYK
ncbi:hypothetical protein Avbf_06347 [Armadillidium vulgare]|nr:hypothetical protein Avbf_06347 [Armadillidium vulgare]